MKVLRLVNCFVFLLISTQAFAQAGYQERPADQKQAVQEALETLKKTMAAKNTSPLTSLQATVKGTFWRNPEWVKILDLSADQQKKMDEIFQQFRLKLIDLTGSLQKEELILEPLLGPTRPGPEAEAKILSQIDRIAEARAELEKANSKMLVGILQVLNAEQWSKLPMPPFRAPGFYKGK
jgi:hypothetical protein